jgi:hypothetical protein
MAISWSLQLHMYLHILTCIYMCIRVKWLMTSKRLQPWSDVTCIYMHCQALRLARVAQRSRMKDVPAAVSLALALDEA